MPGSDRGVAAGYAECIVGTRNALKEPMPFWFGKVAIVVAALAMIVIRAPHGKRSRERAVATSRRGTVELIVLTLAWIGFLVPLLWVVSPWLSVADFGPRPEALAGGALCFAAGLWLLHRSHVDLGTNWSITLELREQHELVTQGVYARIRHPMYLAFLLYGAGQALVVPNWVAGPAYLIAFTLVCALRIGAEERMMAEQFGEGYRAYMRRTKRLVPGVW
jgi:protein-S-isoprenylcysteine O-methyltransferase Ste14